MTQYRVYIVHRGLKEIIPRRAADRANATGQWFKHIIPVQPRKAYGYKTEVAAMRALDRRAQELPNPDEWRGLVWMAGQENKPAVTVAI